MSDDLPVNYTNHIKPPGKRYAENRREHLTWFRWFYGLFGTNWRISEAQLVAGRVQLRKLPDRVIKRRELTAHLNERLPKGSALRISQVMRRASRNASYGLVFSR